MGRDARIHPETDLGLELCPKCVQDPFRDCAVCARTPGARPHVLPGRFSSGNSPLLNADGNADGTMFAMDGCAKGVRYLGHGTQYQRDPRSKTYFADGFSDAGATSADKKVRDSGHDAAEPDLCEASCGQHMSCAREKQGNGPEKLSDNCIVGAICSHGIPLRGGFINSTRPEHFGLYVWLIRMRILPFRAIWDLYIDFNCKFAAHFRNLGLNISYADYIRFLTPWMHGASHEMRCRLLYSGLFADSSGRRHGEYTEVFWSRVRKMWGVARYMMRHHRIEFYEEGFLEASLAAQSEFITLETRWCDKIPKTLDRLLKRRLELAAEGLQMNPSIDMNSERGLGVARNYKDRITRVLSDEDKDRKKLFEFVRTIAHLHECSKKSQGDVHDDLRVVHALGSLSLSEETKLKNKVRTLQNNKHIKAITHGEAWTIEHKDYKVYWMMYASKRLLEERMKVETLICARSHKKKMMEKAVKSGADTKGSRRYMSNSKLKMLTLAAHVNFWERQVDPLKAKKYDDETIQRWLTFVDDSPPEWNDIGDLKEDDEISPILAGFIWKWMLNEAEIERTREEMCFIGIEVSRAKSFAAYHRAVAEKALSKIELLLIEGHDEVKKVFLNLNPTTFLQTIVAGDESLLNEDHLKKVYSDVLSAEQTRCKLVKRIAHFDAMEKAWELALGDKSPRIVEMVRSYHCDGRSVHDSGLEPGSSASSARAGSAAAVSAAAATATMAASAAVAPVAAAAAAAASTPVTEGFKDISEAGAAGAASTEGPPGAPSIQEILPLYILGILAYPNGDSSCHVDVVLEVGFWIHQRMRTKGASFLLGFDSFLRNELAFLFDLRTAAIDNGLKDVSYSVYHDTLAKTIPDAAGDRTLRHMLCLGVGAVPGVFGDGTVNLTKFLSNAHGIIGRWKTEDRCGRCRRETGQRPHRSVVYAHANRSRVPRHDSGAICVFDDLAAAFDISLVCKCSDHGCLPDVNCPPPDFFCTQIYHTHRPDNRGHLPCEVRYQGGELRGATYRPFALLWHTWIGPVGTGIQHWAVSIDLAAPGVASKFVTIDGVAGASFLGLPRQEEPWRYACTAIVWEKTS